MATGGAYTSDSAVGYSLGLTGGILMLSMLLYPVRKRLRTMHAWGPMKYWFRLHMLGGILGPMLVLFHSTFRVGSLNAAVALGSMLLVVASGIVGRYIYRRIHNGLYGSRASMAELQKAVDSEFASLSVQLGVLPAALGEIARFAEVSARSPQTWRARLWHMVVVTRMRHQTGRRIRRALEHAPQAHSGTGAGLAPVLKTIDRLLDAVQRTAQFSTYERLFSLWHVVHIPFLGMLVVTAGVHVVAVHFY